MRAAECPDCQGCAETNHGGPCQDCNETGLITCDCGKCDDGVITREVSVRNFGEWSLDTEEVRCENARALTADEAAKYHVAYMTAASETLKLMRASGEAA